MWDLLDMLNSTHRMVDILKFRLLAKTPFEYYQEVSKFLKLFSTDDDATFLGDLKLRVHLMIATKFCIKIFCQVLGRTVQGFLFQIRTNQLIFKIKKKQGTSYTLHITALDLYHILLQSDNF